MKYNSHILILIIAACGLFTCVFPSCSDSKSYANMLSDENKNVNAFLAKQRVIPYIPKDSVFEVGPNAPYYMIEPEGNVYMQVLNVGNGERPKDDQMVYFRYLRHSLGEYAAVDTLPAGYGNATDMEYEATWFRMNNLSLTSSAQYGYGIQMPMLFLGFNADVNIVIKSQYGLTSEQSYVTPYLYRVRYFKPGV